MSDLIKRLQDLSRCAIHDARCVADKQEAALALEQAQAENIGLVEIRKTQDLLLDAAKVRIEHLETALRTESETIDLLCMDDD